MELTLESRGEALLARVEDSRIDALAAISFKDAMMAAATEPEPRVVLDLSKVQFVDSSGLGAIVAVLKYYAPDKTLELACLNPMVAKVFTLTRLDQVFRIHDRVPAGPISA